MKCQYPLCRALALWVPVISIPTVRTVGLIQPVLSPLATDPQVMAKAELSINMAIRQYQEALEDYKRTCNNMVQTAEATVLLGRGVCHVHRVNFNFLDWFGHKDWECMKEAARVKGVMLDTKNVSLDWQQADWEPSGKYMEMQR